MTASLGSSPGSSRAGGECGAAPGVTELFRDHHLEFVRIAMVMTGDLGTAEDVVQDAFERVHKRWHQIRDPARAVAYARSAVLNGCRSALRKSAVARRNASQLAVFAGLAGPAARDPAAVADVRSELIAALRRLPRRQLEVLVLRYYLDLDPPEIAHILRIRPSSVRATATRGLAGLARSLGQEQE